MHGTTLTLENLPRDILATILRLSNCLPSAESPLSEGLVVPIDGDTFVPGILEWQQERILEYRRKQPRRNIAPLLLCSRLLGDMSLDIMLELSTFKTRSTPDLSHMVHLLGDKKLRLIRNIALVLYSDDDYSHASLQTDDDPGSEAAVDDATSLIARLPSRLRRLRLTMPYHPWPCFTTDRQTHWRLRWALDRFRDLLELDLDCADHWLHIDMFTNLTAFRYSDFFMDHDPAIEQPAPKFPMLRRLRLQGCLTHRLGSRGLAKALSEEQLPALEALALLGILVEEEDEAVFSPEALQVMHPLREFEWGPYDGIRKTLGSPHQVPSKQHFDALRERHGETLRVLKVEVGLEAWGGWLSGFSHEDDVDEDYFEWFKGAMPNLDVVKLSM